MLALYVAACNSLETLISSAYYRHKGLQDHDDVCPFVLNLNALTCGIF